MGESSRNFHINLSLFLKSTLTQCCLEILSGRAVWDLWRPHAENAVPAIYYEVVGPALAGRASVKKIKNQNPTKYSMHNVQKYPEVQQLLVEIVSSN